MITLAFALKAFAGASFLYLVACAASRLHRRLDRGRSNPPTPVRYVARLNGRAISTQDRAVAAMLRQAGYEIITETNPAL